MKCPVCGAGELVHDTRDLRYAHRGQQTIFQRVTGEFCTNCNEGIFNAEESRRNMASMLTFNKQVDSALSNTSFITAVRKN